MSNTMKFLVVDDFSTMRRIVKGLLQELGYTDITEADDGNTALPLLKGKVDAGRYAQWEKNLRSFDPGKTYRMSGGNWNVVAVSGEWLFHQEGLRPNTRFIEQSLAPKTGADTVI